ncbi:helix-turn-helix domain-containing protein [Actinoplanes sp. NPDC026619]|uniref:helix-turn-helix domain-containing protein n=1 Tax=Actinoplanes sp. NPDC026619 TaxID=3155798 RepID=UPI0033CB4080
MRAPIVALSREQLTVSEIGERVGCHPRTVRSWIHRFNVDGQIGLGDRDRPGLAALREAV